MNEGQISDVAIFLLFFSVFMIGLYMGQARQIRKVNKAIRKRVSDPFNARKAMEELKLNTTGYGIYGQRLEPGTPIEIPEPFAQELPPGRIEKTYPPMPWRLEIAAMAMQGFCSDSIAKARLSEFHKGDTKKVQEAIAEVSLEQADALLKAFNESEPKKTLKEMTPSFGVVNSNPEDRESEYDLHTKGASFRGRP